MLEKMFTTKMSADKKKLQSRFSKIRSKNGKLSKLIGGILFGIIIVAIICVGVMIAVNNTKDYRMTDDEFSDYINRPIGAIMADIDYVDDEKLVFHYLEGFFIIDQQSYEILNKINLSKLNIAGHTQGDCFTVFKIDKDGTFAYLTNEGLNELVKDYDNYIINLETGEVKIGDMPTGTELFANYADTFLTVKDAAGWTSTRCIIDGDQSTYYLTVQDSVIGAIQFVTVYDKAGDNVETRYVFGNDYVSLSQQKVNIIHESLNDHEEILTNSGFQWEVNEDKVKAVFNKLSEIRQMKHIDVKDGNYDVRLYNIWSNDESYPMLFIIDNYKLELLFSMRITEKEHTDIVSLLRVPELPAKEFHPQDIKNITDAEIIVNEKLYPILVRSTLEKIEQMLSGAKIIKGGTACPFTASLMITKEDGEQGVITLATDSCAVFKSGDTYYDYSDGDNSEMLGYFGLDAETIIDMIAKR